MAREILQSTVSSDSRLKYKRSFENESNTASAKDRDCCGKATNVGFSVGTQKRSAALAVGDDGHLLLQLTCRSAAGNLTGSVPYALAASMEVG